MNSSSSESECVRLYLLCQMSTNTYSSLQYELCAYERVCIFVSTAEKSGRGHGVIGSSLSPQTGGTFHHRGISFQFSKPCHTSDTINKVFFFFFKHREEKCKSAAI